MTDILQESSIPALIKALETNLHAHVPLCSHLPGTILWDEPDLLGLLTDLDPSENCVYRHLGFQEYCHRDVYTFPA